MEYTIGKEIIKVENLDYQIGSKLILRNIGNEKIPFSIVDLVNEKKSLGQIVAIIGRSGSGKSTFFKNLTGLVTPSKGTILVQDLKNKDSFKTIKEGEVGFVQQNYPLSRNQSVLQMLKTAVNMGNHSRTSSESLINEYLDSWGLSKQKNLFANQLSGGQRQRVAIIEQLLCSHHFMVFDEPFSGLDIGNVLDVKNSFRKIADQDTINTIIFSTHDIDLAVEIADLIYVMGFELDEKGQKLEGGTLIDCLDLKKMGLAWKEYSSAHKDLSNDICKTLINKG